MSFFFCSSTCASHSFLRCSFAGHPSCPVTSRRFVHIHTELRGPLHADNFKKTWKRGSQYLHRGPLSPWRCAVPSEQTRLRWWTEAAFVYSPCQGTLGVTRCQWGGETLEMRCSSQVSEVIRRKLGFCKKGSSNNCRLSGRCRANYKLGLFFFVSFFHLIYIYYVLHSSVLMWPAHNGPNCVHASQTETSAPTPSPTNYARIQHIAFVNTFCKRYNCQHNRLRSLPTFPSSAASSIIFLYCSEKSHRMIGHVSTCRDCFYFGITATIVSSSSSH